MNTPEIRDVLERLRAEDLSAPDMEDMDAQEYLENLDFDKLEECFEGYISSLDQLSEKIKTQESAIMSLDGAKLEQEKQEIEKHMHDLQGAIARLEDFEKDPQYNIKTEEDAEEFEKRLTSELLGTAEILEFNYEEFSRRQLDIDKIRLENAFLRQQLEKVPIRNLETFDNDIQKELEVKYPYMFKHTDEPERPREEWEDEVDEILAKYASPAPQSPEQTVMESPT